MGALMEQNRAGGIEITPDTNRVGWGGEPLDLVFTNPHPCRTSTSTASFRPRVEKRFEAGRLRVAPFGEGAIHVLAVESFPIFHVPIL